jgi:hypothetical protein
MSEREIRWNSDKDAQLRSHPTRGGVGLAECAAIIETGQILDDAPHPKRQNQRMFIIEINGYAYAVPYTQDGNVVFLKTAFPSRKHTEAFLK